MSFWLKKAVSLFLMPVQACLVLGVIGVILLWTRRAPRLARWLATLSVVLLTIAANKQVGYALIGSLEHQYAPLPEFSRAADLPASVAACRYVVVLGGGHAEAEELPSTGRLSTAALARLVEGIRLWRLLPEARLVTSGHGAPGHPDHSEILARAAVSLGVPRDRILQLTDPRDTAEEAVALRRLLGDAPFVLVTSASHMPRAMGLCRGQSLQAVPAPADFVTRGEKFQWGDLGWDLSGLERSTKAVSERLGLVWTRLRGQTR